jgi:hypothetical protein
VVYVLDRSASMGLSGALDVARQEVVASLRRLPATTRFQVVPYNRQAEPLRLDHQVGLVPAAAPTVEQAVRLLEEVSASGGTDHRQALARGLGLRPEVLYFATDADDQSAAEVRSVGRCNQGRTAIHVIELGRGAGQEDGPLRRLAAENGGTYRRVAPGE